MRREPLGAPDSRPVMKGTSLLNLYLAVLENGVPSASLRRELLGPLDSRPTIKKDEPITITS